jgi:hypothetical protein
LLSVSQARDGSGLDVAGAGAEEFFPGVEATDHIGRREE